VGALSGTATALRDGVWPATLRRWMAGDTGHAPAGAESFYDIRQRVLPVWERLAEQYAGRTIVVVAHGVVCKVLLVSLLPGCGVGDWQRLGETPNGGISELVREECPAWRAVRVSDVPAEGRRRLRCLRKYLSRP